MSDSLSDNDNDDEYDEYESPTLYTLSGVDTSLDPFVLEEYLTNVLILNDPSLPVSVMLVETDYGGTEGTILFSVDCDCDPINTSTFTDEDVLRGVREYLTSNAKIDWITNTASAIDIVTESDDCVEYITEDEAYQLWLEQTRETVPADTLVASPDGTLVTPVHYDDQHNTANTDEQNSGPHALHDAAHAGLSPSSTSAQQLERDPGLLDFDNVPRVHYTTVTTDNQSLNFSKPIVFTTAKNEHENEHEQPVTDTDTATEDTTRMEVKLRRFQTNLRDAIQKWGDTTVRTGNRETLVTNGFHDSKPATLRDVGVVQTRDDERHDHDNKRNDPTFIFNPVQELPLEFQAELGCWIDREPIIVDPNTDNDNTNTGNPFPNAVWNRILNQNKNENETDPKFTLCIANEGFGIGMHQHGPALFFLTQGVKKWYLSSPTPIDKLLQRDEQERTSSTHPGFYQGLSSHKCLQKPGELLFVPNLWYHEIYNLESPTIGIQALSGELD